MRFLQAPPRVRVALIAALLSSLAQLATAVSFRPTNYFVNTTKGIGKATSCTASSRTNAGTYSRVFAYSAAHCPGVPLYAWTKGAPNSMKWGEEQFYSEGGFIKLLGDTGSVGGGYLNFSHALRDSATLRKGLPVFKDGIVNNYLYIDHFGYWVETWEGNTCPSTKTDQSFATGFDDNEWVGTIQSWLYDCRAGRPCQNGLPYDVEVMARGGGSAEPGGPVDHFWFARWRDPMDGNQWRGLGPIKFWCDGPSGWCAPPSESHFLVDCEVSPTCYSCPDP